MNKWCGSMKNLPFEKNVLAAGFLATLVSLTSCSTLTKTSEPVPAAPGPFLLRMKGNVNDVEKVAYFHRSRSTSFEDVEVRSQKEETIEFVSVASTAKVDPNKDRFTQTISIEKKSGTANLHDFAMPGVGEKLEITADSSADFSP
jgi:hypothetical protein